MFMERAGLFNSADIDIFNESWMSEWEEPLLFTDGDASGDGYVNSADWYFMASLGLNLQTVWVLADLNGDFLVDELDAEIVEDNLGMANPTRTDGDLDGDGDIDADDVDLVFAQWGLELSVVS
jgi:hypothetical protein